MASRTNPGKSKKKSKVKSKNQQNIKIALIVVALFAIFGTITVIKSFAATGDTYAIPLQHLDAIVGYGPTQDYSRITLIKDTVSSKRDVQVVQWEVSKTGSLFRRYYVPDRPAPYNTPLPDEQAYKAWFTARAGKRVRGCINVRALDDTKITMQNMWKDTYPLSEHSLAAGTTYQQKCSPYTMVSTTGNPDYRTQVHISQDPSKLRIANFFMQEQ